MSAGRAKPQTSLPKVTLERHPTTVSFTNLVTAADMEYALSVLPRNAKAATFSDLDNEAMRHMNIAAADADSSDDEADHKDDVLRKELEPKAIKYFFKHNRYIQHATFSGISSAHAAVLVTSLTSDQKLFSLSIREHELTGRDLAAINTALQTNTTLRALNINDGEELTGRHVTVLSHTHLTALYTANNGLNGTQVALLLDNNPQLLTLDVSLNNLVLDENPDNSDSDNENNDVNDAVDDVATLPDDTDLSPRSASPARSDEKESATGTAAESRDGKETHSLTALTTAIQNHRFLRELNLMECKLDIEDDDENAANNYTNRLKEQLYIALFTHPALTNINISHNVLNAHTLRLVASLTIRRKQLTHLDMTGCVTDPTQEIRDDDPDYPQVYMYTLDSIRMLFCARLTHLSLKQNNLGDNELAALRPQLRPNQTLVELCLANNAITENGVQHLVPFLERTTTLQVLDLSHNPIKLSGLLSILEALQRNKNCAVHTLVFFGCSINIPNGFTEDDRNNFLKKIPRTLLHFNLGLNGISLSASALVPKVQQKLRSNQTLLRFTQRVSPLIAFVRANITHPLHNSVLPVIPQITEHLEGDTIEVDIRRHRGNTVAATNAAKPS